MLLPLIGYKWNKVMREINQQTRERIVHNILSKYAKENGLVKYEYPDGFYVFGNPDSQDLADKKHEEWIESNRRQ